MLRESARLNGLTDVALTKLDVLSGFDTIQICVAYEYKGKRMDYPPQEQGALDLVSPVYESMPGWKEDITACKTWDELPEAAPRLCAAPRTAFRRAGQHGIRRPRPQSDYFQIRGWTGGGTFLKKGSSPGPLPKAFDQWGRLLDGNLLFLYRKRTSCI